MVRSIYGRLRSDLHAAVAEAQAQRVVAGRGRGARDRLAAGPLDERVAALERALGIMPGQREREPVEVAPPPGRLAGRRRLAGQRGAVAAGRVTPGCDAAPPGGADLAQMLVQPRAVAPDVLGGRAG